MKLKNTELVINSVLAAIVTVLGYVALDLQSIKITFEGFPIIVAAYLFGPLSGMLVAGIGTFLYQLIRYGLTPTTLLWVMPYLFSGLFIGLISKRKTLENNKRFFFAIIINELIVTLINTFSIYVDSHMYGWYFPGLITGVLPLRIGVTIVKGILYALILRELLPALEKTIIKKEKRHD